MKDNHLTEQAQRDMETAWKLKHRAIEILDIINMEWQSDPTSVQCFDLRIVRETKELMAQFKELQKRLPLI